ncbi:MAG: type II secretion system protein GspD, partial [Rhodoferax sp.]|nr:type II secretion system protein GspD [Rhodoferax sp.]
TNLMVFLRPVVVRDARDSDRLSLDRYDLMSAGLLANQPVPNNLVPINDSPTLPPAPASKPAASASAVPAPLVSPLITTEH